MFTPATRMNLEPIEVSHGGKYGGSVRASTVSTTADSDDDEVDEVNYVILTSEEHMEESNSASVQRHIESGMIRATLKYECILHPDGFVRRWDQNQTILDL